MSKVETQSTSITLPVARIECFASMTRLRRDCANLVASTIHKSEEEAADLENILRNLLEDAVKTYLFIGRRVPDLEVGPCLTAVICKS